MESSLSAATLAYGAGSPSALAEGGCDRCVACVAELAM